MTNPPSNGARARAGAAAVTVLSMNDVVSTHSAVEHGDPEAAERLLPLVYDALRELAARKLEQERPGQTLQATALVHEAYLRLAGNQAHGWNGRGHFYA